MSAALAIYDLDHRDDEALAASEWARLLAITPRAFNLEAVATTSKARNAAGQLVCTYRFRDLPERWRDELTDARRAQGVSLCRDLLEIAERAGAWTPPKHWSKLPPATQKKAEAVRAIMVSYYGWLEQGRGKTTANALARAEWLKAFGESCTEKTIRRWEKKLEERGAKYIAVDRLRLEAFCDWKSCPHPAARKDLPPDFKRWFAAQFLHPSKGVPGMGAIFADCEAAWDSGAEIPGLGCRNGDVPFPFTQDQLRPLMPGRAAREIAGRGKFLAKTEGYSAAPPLEWKDVEPGRVVMFDDKTLDLEVLTDDGTKVFRPVVYIAYCAGTRRVLAYIVREDGCARQLDVEALMASVMGTHGLGGPEAGWQTIYIVERGTVAISDVRKEFLEAYYAGRLEIRRTSMIGGKNGGGDYAQQGKGNFMGKGVIEGFMHSVDHFAKRAPGATGNSYDRQPATLGDTTATLTKLINSAKAGHSASRTLVEESIATAAFARLLEYSETDEAIDARTASERTGVKPPLLYFTDFVALLGEFFRAHNNRRGHRMQGFGTVRVPHPDPEIAATGRVLYPAESPNDKAKRMLDAMALAGRRLVVPAFEDIMVLINKVRRVTVRANGVVVKGVGPLGEDYRYWSETSRAQRDAVAVQGGEKTFLALYNPVAPDALYLLANPPSHLAAKAVELPTGFAPQLYEVLPVYDGPSIIDRDAMERRSEKVHRFNAHALREVAVQGAPVLEELTREREITRDRLDSYHAALRVGAPPVAPAQLDATDFGREVAAAEVVVNDSTVEVATRAGQREAAIPDYAARLAARAAAKANSKE